jgi:hypothetical protein
MPYYYDPELKKAFKVLGVMDNETLKGTGIGNKTIIIETRPGYAKKVSAITGIKKSSLTPMMNKQNENVLKAYSAYKKLK